MLLAICLTSLLLSASASPARAAWTPPVSVSVAGSAARAPQVAVDGDGNTTVVWESGTGSSRSIRSAFHPTGGPWDASFTRIPAGTDCFDPQLAVNPAGAAVVVAECTAGTASVHAAYRAAGGSWAGSIAVPGSGGGVDPRVAIDDDGHAVVVWESGSTVQSSYRPAAGPWGAAAQASPAGHVVRDPQVAISSTGNARAVWRHELNRNMTDPVVTVESVNRQDAGAWSATPAVLTSPATSTIPIAEGEPQISWNTVGGRTAVWANRTTPALAILENQWGSGAGGWGGDFADHSTSDGVRSVEEPQVALDDAGHAVAVWRGYDSGTGSFRTQAATTDFLSDDWSAPITLADVETGAADPEVAVNPAGDATVVWRTIGGEISAVSHPTGGPFSTATPISNASHTGFGDPEVTVNTSGDAIAAWAASGTTPTHIAVAIDDVTPPALSAISVPATVAKGANAAMTAAATDAWSAATLAWDFGDGSTGVGEAVDHAYATTGAKTVSVTATDSAGNSATQTREIVVTSRLSPLALQVTVPRQSWRKIKKSKGVSLRCTLDAVGTCKAKATVSRRAAKRLGLKVRRGATTLRVGSGRVAIDRADRPTKLKVKLTRKARAAIGEATRNVPLKLAVTGSAPDRGSASLTRKLKIRR